MRKVILSKDKFPEDLGGGLESDLILDDDGTADFGTKRTWSVAIANKTRLKKAESEAFRLKLEELTGLKWKVDSVSKFVFHYVPNSKEKIMAKKTRTDVEQMPLIDVGPENLVAIAKEVRIYKKHQFDRLSAGKKEVTQRDKIRAMVKEAKLQRLPDGKITFEADNAIICVEPQEDLITIKEKAPKKSKKGKKGMKKKVETEEEQHDAQSNT